MVIYKKCKGLAIALIVFGCIMFIFGSITAIKYEEYNGDAYTGIQNAIVDASNNVLKVGGIIIFALGNALHIYSEIKEFEHHTNQKNHQELMNALTRVSFETTEKKAKERNKHEAKEKPYCVVEEKAKHEPKQNINHGAEEKANGKTEEGVTSAFEKKTISAFTKSEKTLAEKLEYALKYISDDGMIKYLENVQNEAVQNILKSPKETIRAQITDLLNNL